jgi:hypothetical protein
MRECDFRLGGEQQNVDLARPEKHERYNRSGSRHPDMQMLLEDDRLGQLETTSRAAECYALK